MNRFRHPESGPREARQLAGSISQFVSTLEEKVCERTAQLESQKQQLESKVTERRALEQEMRQAKEAGEAGMDHYLAKPIVPSVLIETIESILPATAPRPGAVVERGHAPSDTSNVPAPIDLELLRARCVNDVKFVCSVLDKFKGEDAAYLAQLESIGKAAQLENAERLISQVRDELDSCQAFSTKIRDQMTEKDEEVEEQMITVSEESHS